MIKGSGIVIIEKYKGKPVITLFGKDGMNYSDIGGKVDGNEYPEFTAFREGREETANLINILPEELKFYAIPVEFNTYMAYFIYIKGISFNDYVHNVNIIYSQCSSNKDKHWMETNSMTRVPVENMLLSANTHSNFATNIDGQNVQVRGRTMGLIRYGFNAINSLLMSEPVPLYKHYVTNSRLPCLIGTYTYTITDKSVYPIVPNNSNNSSNYAIYIIPNLDNSSNIDDFLKCKRLHIPLTGFSPKNNNEKIIKYLSKNNNNNDEWLITIDSLKIKGNRIYFKSGTLDKIKKFLEKNDFENIKDKLYIEATCKIPEINKLKKILKNQTWSFGIIKEKKDGNDIKLVGKHSVYVL